MDYFIKHVMKFFPDDVCAPCTNEAYTTVCLPASASNKGMASLQVKVNTGVSGNVLLLCLFKHLYPDGIDKAGHPTGFNVGNTRLTGYNCPWIPLFVSLHGLISWQPGSPGAQPCQINSCWYVVDTPGSAILGFSSCERLEVIKMNCDVKIIQDTSQLPSPTPALAEPSTPMKNTPTKSTEDHIKEFCDRFQGIGWFSGEYTIRLCDNAQPVMHAP